MMIFDQNRQTLTRHKLIYGVKEFAGFGQEGHFWSHGVIL